MARVLNALPARYRESMVHASLPIKGTLGFDHTTSTNNVLINQRKGQQFVVMSLNWQADPGQFGVPREAGIMRFIADDGVASFDLLPPAGVFGEANANARPNRRMNLHDLHLIVPEGHDLYVDITDSVTVQPADATMSCNIQGYWEDADRYGRDRQESGAIIMPSDATVVTLKTNANADQYIVVERLYMAGLAIASTGHFQFGFGPVATIVTEALSFNATNTDGTYQIQQLLNCKIVSPAGDNLLVRNVAGFDNQCVGWAQWRVVDQSRTDGIA